MTAKFEPDPADPVLVIGAGATGLAAADALARKGVAAVILEKEQRLAEPWRRRHERLSLNTHRDLSALPGLPYPAGTVAFPPKAAVIRYLETYAAKRGLSIEFGTAVERIERTGGRWTVHTGKGMRTASHVVIATGHDQRPWMPDWPGAGTFRGRLIHSADFGKAGDYAGKRVLVVGAGNSGFDVLNHLATVATKNIWLSARHGPSLLPKRIGKVAVHRFAAILARLPTSVADAAISATQRLALGDLTRHGLPPAPEGGASRLGSEHIAIAVDDGAVAAMKAGRITVVPPVAEFTTDGVVLQDGRKIEPDVVIAATGYRTGLDEMVGALGVLDGKGTPNANGGEQTGQPGLWFIGMRPAIVGHFHSAGTEARAIAAAIAKTG